MGEGRKTNPKNQSRSLVGVKILDQASVEDE